MGLKDDVAGVFGVVFRERVEHKANKEDVETRKRLKVYLKVNYSEDSLPASSLDCIRDKKWEIFLMIF